MYLAFFKYFTRKIFFSRSRQHLIIIALSGLFISSFALLVLQSTMGGLQSGLIDRSKNVFGHAVVFLDEKDEKFALKILSDLEKLKLDSHIEFEIELLAKNYGQLTPIILHGIDTKKKPPQFLKDIDLEGIAIGRDLIYKLDTEVGNTIGLMAPAFVDTFMGEIPREVNESISDTVLTNMPEVDGVHAWVRKGLIQNMARKRIINKIRIFSPYDFEKLKAHLLFKFKEQARLKTWEEMNDTLLSAFRLESSVMAFLFIAMTFLVSLAITSGYIIFFNKIKVDLTGLWILGLNNKQTKIGSFILVQAMGLFASLGGIVLGLIFLWAFDQYAPEIMPDIFVDRKIPVKITLQGGIVSFLVPYLVSTLFGFLALIYFLKDENRHIKLLRSFGQS